MKNKIPKFEAGSGYYNHYTEEDIQRITHKVSFSGGRTSAYLLHKLVEVIPKEKLLITFANTGREDEATLQFVKDNEDYLGMKFHWLEYDLDENNNKITKEVNFETASRNGEPLKKSIIRGDYVPNVTRRACTIEAKIVTMERWLKENRKLTHDDYVTYIGIRFDEPKRWSKEVGQYSSYSAEAKAYPLVDWKTHKKDVLDYWKGMPFDLQLVEPFGNCDLCYLKSTKKRIHILKQRPEVAKWWSQVEEEMTAKKGYKCNFDLNYSVKQLYRIATGEALLDESKAQNFDIDCTCNVD